MISLPKAVRQRVRERANHRCEYCHASEAHLFGGLLIAHIQPPTRGGSDDEVNLCLICFRCNQSKWAQTHGIDSETGQQIPLFNPRVQWWGQHFEWREDGSRIIGVTGVGQVTVEALHMNTRFIEATRRLWRQAGWQPPTMQNHS